MRNQHTTRRRSFLVSAAKSGWVIGRAGRNAGGPSPVATKTPSVAGGRPPTPCARTVRWGTDPRPRSRAAPVRSVRLRLTKRTEAIPWQGYHDDRNWFHSWGQVKSSVETDSERKNINRNTARKPPRGRARPLGGVSTAWRPETWRVVPQLPFELASLPQAWFRLVDMQVVSYALPALIAIGKVRHARGRSSGVLGMVRQASTQATLRTLAEI